MSGCWTLLGPGIALHPHCEAMWSLVLCPPAGQGPSQRKSQAGQTHFLKWGLLPERAGSREVVVRKLTRGLQTQVLSSSSVGAPPSTLLICGSRPPLPSPPSPHPPVVISCWALATEASSPGGLDLLGCMAGTVPGYPLVGVEFKPCEWMLKLLLTVSEGMLPNTLSQPPVSRWTNRPEKMCQSYPVISTLLCGRLPGACTEPV